MNVHQKTRDALDILRRSNRKVQRVAADVERALKHREELRLVELNTLKKSIQELTYQVDKGIELLQRSLPESTSEDKPDSAFREEASSLASPSDQA